MEINAVPVDQGRSARYTIPGELASALDDSALITKYAEAVRGTTAYHLEQRDATGTDVKGVRVTEEPTGVAVAYLKFHSQGLHHNYLANFGISTLRQGTQVMVNVSCPDTMRIENANAGLAMSPFVERDQAIADLRSICGKAELTFTRREAGEVNVPFSDSSVYANFKRKLLAASTPGADVKQGDLAKFLWFYVKDGTKTQTVGVTIFPYRNGSKVSYMWLNRIACPPNGSCTFDPAAAKRVSEAIAQIAND